MALKKNWNRIIDLKFLTQEGMQIPKTAIPCPETGRKPSITITGSFTTDDYLPAFNVTVKNLYMDLPTVLYPKLEVRAGYAGRLQPFTGTIYQMYQEQPGPEGTTIIQCLNGNIKNWEDATIKIEQAAETFSLYSVLRQIATATGLSLSVSPIAVNLAGKSKFEFEGTPKNAVSRLKQMFSDEGLYITVRGDTLYAFTKNDRSGPKDFRINFITTPAQMQAGEEDTAYATVTAPWEPELRPGDRLTFPSKNYLKNFNVVNSEETSIIVTTIQFHFSTTGSTNQMTVQGYAVK